MIPFKLRVIISAETMRRLYYGEIHSLREAFQEGKAQDRPSQTANLGRTEPRHQKAGKQQGLQQKEITGMEAGTTANCL